MRTAYLAQEIERESKFRCSACLFVKSQTTVCSDNVNIGAYREPLIAERVNARLRFVSTMMKRLAYSLVFVASAISAVR
jgi:hypothetical protein